MHHDDDAASTEQLTDRRQLMKKAAVSAVAAGVVWSAPRVEGLSVRPSYAAAASGATETAGGTMLFRNSLPSAAGATSGLALCGGGASARGVRVGVPLVNATEIKINSFFYNGNGTPQITSINTGPNVSDVVRKSGAPATFPANLDGTYDTTVTTVQSGANAFHQVRVVFSCC